ncbi:MAG: ferredoxin [Thermoproteota archaeon]|jgi:ferredoxin
MKVSLEGFDFQADFNANSHENLLQCLQEVRPDKPIIKHSCGGFGVCGDCKFKVHSGADLLSPMSIAEKKLLGNVFFITKERLACQCSPTGDIDGAITIEILKK